jgi:hypothetical protein
MKEEIKYLNPHILLIINSHGSIRELCTPFRVVFIHPIGGIHSQSSVFVEVVIPYEHHLIVYKIFEKWYPYKYFLSEYSIITKEDLGANIHFLSIDPSCQYIILSLKKITNTNKISTHETFKGLHQINFLLLFIYL